MDRIITDKGCFVQGKFSNVSMASDQSVYEVIRIVDGVALFVEDHFARLLSSLRIHGIRFEMDFSEFKFRISELIKFNQRQHGNVKFIFSAVGNECSWVFTFIPHHYPAPEDYLLGVSTNLYFAERENPNAKVIQNIVRDGANQLIADQKLYEVLLVDRKGLITEGSRSNVFFVKGELFYTASFSMVLPGITRQKVIECLKKLNFQFVEKAVSVDEIRKFDAVFLTGTSPKVLPVRSIGSQVYNPGLPSVIKLIDRYNDLIDQYILNQKNSSKND